MRKQKFKSSFMYFDVETYQRLRDCYLDHTSMQKLKQDPAEFLINFNRYTRKVPDEFKNEIKRIARQLLREYQTAFIKVA